MEHLKTILKDSFLFSRLSSESLEIILQKYKFKTLEYKRGEVILSDENNGENLYFVLDGECEILRRKADGQSISLNVLKTGESFGILAVFGTLEQFPTEVVARKYARVIQIEKKQVMRLVRRYPRISMNVINFLAQRVAFLNEKIATFSSDSITEKLARFILNEMKTEGNSDFIFNLKKCSEIIHAGRASVYRAIDSLSTLGIIKYENKKITVLDINGLERIKK